jgi:5'-nucleotidase/UDP-sugar diphosphatase
MPIVKYPLYTLCLLLLVSSCDNLPSPDPVDPLFGTNRFDSREHETALGDMICDGIVWCVNTTMSDIEPVDFGVLNGGIFDYGLPKGVITANMIPGTLKGDTLAIMYLSGAEVVELFTWLAALHLGENAWAQVSEEVRYTIDWTNGNGSLRDLTIKGLPVEPGKTYRLCTGEPLINGKATSPANPVFPPLYKVRERAVMTAKSVEQAVQEYVASRSQPYIPEIDGRITVEK